MRSLSLLAFLVLAIGPGAALAQTAPSTAATPHCSAGDPVVWINTSSHVYHMQGSKYYGNTKSGKYSCKSAADAAGDHQAKNESTKPGAATPAPTATPKHHWWSGTPKASPSPSP